MAQTEQWPCFPILDSCNRMDIQGLGLGFRVWKNWGGGGCFVVFVFRGGLNFD